MRQTIRGRMILLIALPTLVIYVLVLGLAMAILRDMHQREVEREMTRLAVNFAARFEGAFREAAAVADATAHFMETAPDLAERQIYTQLRANVAQVPAIYGAAMAFEPGSYKTDDSLYSPYVHRDGQAMTEMNITREVYDRYGDEQWEWFRLPKRLERGVWTDPYFDEGAGNVLMVTYSAPFFREGRFRGVTTVDVMLPTLQESVGREILAGLDFVILTKDGEYVYSRTESDIMSRTIFEVAAEARRPEVAAAAADIISGRTGVTAVEGGWAGWTETQWVFYAPIASTGWAFAALLPEREALAGVSARMRAATAALAGALLLIIGCIWYVSGRLARPITKLRSSVLQVASGDLDARVEGITSRDEIGELAESFNRMSADLRSNVARLAQEHAARDKIERDLDIARDIQRGLLPKDAPDLPGFEIAGWNRAADKTGGDYFDWLRLPDGRTIVTVADVTGHGIGPALIVAVCRAYMRASTSTGETDLPTALGRVNDLLHADIPDGRFVTAAVGVIDPATSTMALVSAGQAPMLFYEARSGTVFNWDADDLPLGVAAGLQFEAPRKIRFESGDVLVLTTDGFFEWANAEGESFGTRRLAEFLKGHHALEPAAFIAALHAAVAAHAAGTEQADDLTALIVRRS